MLRLHALCPTPLSCLLILLLLAGVGCDKEETSCPQVCQGRIEGYVLGGDGPVPARLQAHASNQGGASVDVQTQADSTGYYELPVPGGAYTVKAWESSTGAVLFHSVDGITVDNGQADTVVVAGQPVRIDFIGGSLALDLEAPANLEGHGVRCWIHDLSGAHGFIEDYARCENGHVLAPFPLLPPGRYAAGLHLADSDFWLPRGDGARADTIEISAQATTTYAARLPAPAHVLGTVQGSWLALGTSEPSVRAFFAEDQLTGLDYVDGAGAFDIELYVTGPTRLRVYSSSGPDRWVGGYDFAHATVFEVDSAETISGVTIVESGISCQLEGPPEEELEYCYVSLWDSEGRVLLDQAVSVGNPIPISNLIPGAYRLQVEPAEVWQYWFAQFYDGADSLAEATPIVISTEGEVVPITWHLSVSGRISGHVVGPDGEAVRDASIFLSPAADPTQVSLVTTTWFYSNPGFFRIPRLRTGDYKVGARTGSHPATWYPGVADWDSAAVIHVEEGSEISGIDWTLIE